MSCIVALGGTEAGRRLSLDRPELTVGRRLDCDVAIQDPRISRRHARFFRAPEGLFVEDLGSVNGTCVNGKRLAEPERLADGDEVAIGSARFLVELDPDEPHAVAPAGDGASSARLSIVDAPAHAPRVIEVAKLRHNDDHLRGGGGSSPAPAGATADPQLELARLQHKLRTMYRVGEAVASALEPRALLEQVVAALLDVFPQARAASAATVDARTRALRTVAHRARAGEGAGHETLIPVGVFDRVIREGHSVLLRAATDRPSAPSNIAARGGEPPDAAWGFRMGAPLSFRGEALGILHVEADPDLGAFSQADLDLLGGIAAQAGVAVHVAGLHQRLLMRDRLDKDLAIARQIQRNLLPREPPKIPGIDFGVHYEPAFQVGGDFFDFLWLDPTHLGLVVGDVSGKAISGALFMARVASEFRALAPVEADPRRLLERVNRAMADASDDGMFCTALVLSLDLERHVLRYTNAGHTTPLLRRNGTVIPVESRAARTLPIGIEARIDAGEAEVELRPGDTLLLYTDGILEAVARDGSMYGAERLAASLARAPAGARAVLDAVLADLDAFVADAPQADDQTIVCVGIAPPGAATAQPSATAPPRY